MMFIKAKNRAAAKRRGGFTLVEVIVVLVILAILAAVMVPAMTGWIDKAKKEKVVVGCRQAVLAAQTLYTEAYGKGEDAMSALTPDEIKALASVSGSVSDVEYNAANAEVLHLIYTQTPWAVTYCRYPGTCAAHSETYSFTDASAPAWSDGASYAMGQRITAGGLIFECTRAHTSGDTPATRNPTVGSNKSTWKVVGSADGSIPSYSSLYRYSEGVEVTYNSSTYKRTSYNPSADQTPSTDSPYWEKIS